MNVIGKTAQIAETAIIATQKKSDEYWDIVDAEKGTRFLEYTSFLSFELVHDGKALDEPVEEGSFASYNKSQAPVEIVVQIGIQGDGAKLQDALHILDTYANTTKLLHIETPSEEYENFTLERYDYDLKEDDGHGLLIVALHLVEVRMVKTAIVNVRVPTMQKRGLVQGKQADPPSKAGIQSIWHAGQGKAPGKYLSKQLEILGIFKK